MKYEERKEKKGYMKVIHKTQNIIFIGKYTHNKIDYIFNNRDIKL